MSKIIFVVVFYVGTLLFVLGMALVAKNLYYGINMRETAVGTQAIFETAAMLMFLCGRPKKGWGQ